MWGVSEAAPGQKPVVVTGRMAGKRDPGYWETSRMLLESGLCLALQVRKRLHLKVQAKLPAQVMHTHKWILHLGCCDACFSWITPAS